MSSEVALPGGARVTLRVNRQARSLRLRVDQRNGRVLLTVPARVSQRRALQWAAGQSSWIEAALARVPQRLALAPGAVLPFRGTPRRIDHVPEQARTVRLMEDAIMVGGPWEAVEARLMRWLRAEALKLLSEETRSLAARIGARVSRIGVGDPVSRWGSCSSAGAIRYSWRLIMAPDFARRATVAHEVAHLVHMNHGPDFHRLAAALLGGDPGPAREWLRRNGAALHRIGSA